MYNLFINISKSTLVLLLVFISFSACTDSDADLLEAEKVLLQEYLTQNNITTEATASGLYYIETIAGAGNKPTVGQTVEVHYTGTFIDGEKFDSSYDRGVPFKFILGAGQVIKGWDEGISYMKVGTEATLIIPSNLGYGSNPPSGIPPYSTLIFKVKLLGIE